MDVSLDIPTARKQLEEVRTGLDWADTSMSAVNAFWQQCVRDIDGRWQEYVSIEGFRGSRYFYGCQAAIDKTNQAQVRLLRLNIAVRDKIYSTFQSSLPSNATEFQQWLEELHGTLRYRAIEDWVDAVHATTSHTIVVRQEVLPIASYYNDAYVSDNVSGPIFEGFSVEALPIDEESAGLIRHIYPPLAYADVYFDAAQQQLVKLLYGHQTLQSYIYGIAYFYQLLINLHYFTSINTSLYMNLANALLQIAGMKGVEHGIKDFVAMRLQPHNYQKYFYAEVASRNPDIFPKQ